MGEWKGPISKCQLVFWNRNFFSQLAMFQSPGVLASKDARLRTVPFTTYKPCIEEAQRILELLCRVSRVTR